MKNTTKDTARNSALTFTDAPVPHTPTKAEHAKRWNASAKGKAARSKYRHNNSKHQTDAQYLSRKFRAFDGEGETREDGSHIYTLLASKLAGGETTDIIAPPHYGLRTRDIFDYVLETAANDDAINIIYGGSYDFNMWLSDLTEDDLRDVYSRDVAYWQGYRIMWRRGKSFALARVDDMRKRVGNSVIIYDVVPFFQMPFVKACDSYLGENYPGRDLIIENKAKRSNFADESLEDIRRYNDLELQNLLSLAYELRERLNKVGLRPRRWDGPGAVASALLAREGIKDHLTPCPEPVAEAARYAYAGGRFEIIKYGHVEGPAYEYDVNSAYPAALKDVPSLTHGRWERLTGEEADTFYPFALYHITYYSDGDPSVPAPFFRRAEKGSIRYPVQVTGWYWSPEYRVGKLYCARDDTGAFMHVIEAWRFVPDADCPKPFAFIEPLYNKRRALKAAGDGAQVGIKLALNSLYGKLAQQVGARYNRETKTWKTPPFHQLEYAGYTTSYCRAKVLEAVLDNLHNVIAFETDAVFTTVPLDVPLTSNLGDFDRIEFTDLTYAVSGVYFGTTTDGKLISKTRGVDKGTLTRPDLIAAMAQPFARDRDVKARQTRFITAGLALQGQWAKWRTWITADKLVNAEPSGANKRMHSVFCAATDKPFAPSYAPGAFVGQWHNTQCPYITEEHSCEYPLLWVNPNPAMEALEEMRDSHYDDAWE